MWRAPQQAFSYLFLRFQLVVCSSRFLAVKFCDPPSTVVVVLSRIKVLELCLTASSFVLDVNGKRFYNANVSQKVESRICPLEIVVRLERFRGEAEGPNRKVITAIPHSG